jgi:hypothetical protein
MQLRIHHEDKPEAASLVRPWIQPLLADRESVAAILLIFRHLEAADQPLAIDLP